MAEKKLSRKELLKEPDEFLTTTTKTIQFARENPKQVTIGVVVFVLCLVAILGFLGIRRHQQVKSLELFDKAFVQYQQLIHSNEPPSAEKLTKINEDFEAVTRDYGSFAAGQMALLYSGHVLYGKGDYKAALERYERMQSASMARGALESMVLYHVAMTRFALKDYEQAETAFKRLSKDTDSPYRREAFAAVARIYESMGKNKEAAQAYKEYLKMFPEAPDAAFIRARLAEVSFQG